MTSCEDCPIANAMRQRIGYLEERLERAEAALEADIMHPPHEWCLGSLQAVIARRLAKGPVSTDALTALLEEASPTDDGRDRSHIRALVCGLRKKLADFGWLVQPANTHSPVYRLHPDQQTAFAAAMRGEGSHAYPAMSTRRRSAA